MLLHLIVILIVCYSLSILFRKIFHIRREFVRTRECLKSIPGPEVRRMSGDLCLIGNGKLNSDNFYKHLQAFAQLYQSEGLFKLRFGNKFIVCVFRRSLLGSLLGSSVNIRKSSEYNFLNDWLSTGLLVSDAQLWKDQRRILTKKVFHQKIIRDSFIDKINKHGNSFVKTPKLDLELTKMFQITTEILVDIFFKPDLKSNVLSDYIDLMHTLAACFPIRALSPLLWPDWIFKLSSTGRTFHTSLTKLKNITRKIVETSKSQFLKFFQHPLAVVENQVDTFLFAGHDTTALVLNWTLFWLGRMPNYQEILHREICENIEHIDDIKVDELNRLTRLDAFVWEVLRLHPPVPMIGREICEETNLEGHTIPVGTMLYILIDQLQLEDFLKPKHFDSSRFLDRRSHSSVMPFSAGPRNCIGKSVALTILKMITAKVIVKYRLKSPELDTVDTKYNIVLTPTKHNIGIEASLRV